MPKATAVLLPRVVPVLAVLGLLVAVVAPAPAAAQPSNDRFADRTVITAVPFTDEVDTSTATTDPGEPSPSCAYNLAGTVWYEYTAPVDGTVFVDTFRSDFDTVLGVWTGSSLDELSPVECNDDGSPWERDSFMQFEATSGDVYQIQVGGHDGATGRLRLRLRQPVRPANDDFIGRMQIAELPFLHEVDTTLATREAQEPGSGCAPIGRTVWYEFTPGIDMQVRGNTFGSDFDTVLAVWRGPELGALSPVACNDDWEDLQSRIVFSAEAGTTYHIQAGGFAGDWGRLVLRLLPGTSCRMDGGVVTVRLAGEDEGATIGRDGGGRLTGAAALGACRGLTVNDVDEIVLQDLSGDGQSFQVVFVDLTRGPLGPGATPEPDGISEIEISMDLGTGYDEVVILGWGGPDDISIGGPAGLVNLNGDDDADIVSVSGLERYVLLPGKGDDTVTAGGGRGTGGPAGVRALVYAGNGHDRVTGGLRRDRLIGGSGNDRMAGGLSRDQLIGGSGNDRMVGGLGHDFLSGGAGHDDLRGNDGNDGLFGWSGHDRLDGGRGNDECHGGRGNDVLVRCELAA